MFNEVLVINQKENRKATKEEITRLIDNNLLFINFHTTGGKVGRVFIDLAMYVADVFLLRPVDAAGEETNDATI